MTDMTPKQIDAALKAGIIDEMQAKSMRAKAESIALKSVQNTPTPKKETPLVENASLIGNEDDMRFLRSFSDVFISIGIGLLALGLMGLSALSDAWVGIVGAGVMWIFAEYFGRKKRAHLPTLVSALWFLFFIYRAAGHYLPDAGYGIGVMPALLTLGAMLLFYWRFRLPFSIALIALSLLILVYSIIGNRMPIGLFLLLSGLSFFGAALLYDMRDTDRKTRYADNAFWLHFAAAPLILHGIMAYTLTVRKNTALSGLIKFPTLNNTDALVMLLIVGFLGLVGLAVNRRALLVSSLGYAAFAIAMLVKQTSLGFGSATAFAFLLLGIVIVFLGAGWHSARRGLLKVLPQNGVFGKIFPPAL
ncbi:MAG: hypothetical protein V3U57_09000 [Robiginitomaculum sp.]